MHEAHAVRSAIQSAMAVRDAARSEESAAGEHEHQTGAFRHLELEIMDPTRATPEAVQVYAPVILDELGMRSVSFDIFVRAVRCSMCGGMTHAEPSDPVCRSCGAPVPRTDGPAIDAHWTKAVPVPIGAEPTHDAGSHLADHRHHVKRVTR